MRIAYIVAVFPVPSETFVAREVLAMISRGFEVDVFAVRKPNSEQVKNLSSEARALVARVKYLSRSELALAAPFAALQLEARELNDRLACSNSKSRSSLRMLRAAAIARHVNAGGYDRVHAHWPYATQLAMLVHAMTRVPLSASVHAHEVVHENGHFELAFERLEFASFCNAAAMAKLQTTLGGEAASRCHLIYHGVNLSQFAPSALPSLASGLRVLSAGRLTPTKGFDRLLRAVAGARALGADVRLTIAGEGALRADLESLARELTIGDAVTFRGWVQHSEMPSLIANSHVFALMANTEFHDGLPNVVLESMACGRPVVLSPLPAADEAVVTGESGFLLSTSDAEDECAERLVELAQGAGTLERMGAKARDIARTRFDEDSCMDQLAELFAEGHPSQHNMVRSSRPAGVTLSVVTIAKNEERDLPHFLSSFLPWADEIVICDDGSTDRTRKIAESAGPRVTFFSSPRTSNEGFHSQRNKALERATGDWLLHVDVDTRMTTELGREVRRAIACADKDLYDYSIINYFLNRPAPHAMGANQRYPWLVRRGMGRFRSAVHERLETDVPATRRGRLRNRMHHLGDADFGERLAKNAHYSTLERHRSVEQRSRTSLGTLLWRPPYQALRSYFWRGGALDGIPGALWALYQLSGSLNRYLLEYSAEVGGNREEVEARLRTTQQLSMSPVPDDSPRPTQLEE